jgi:hypothetical protein
MQPKFYKSIGGEGPDGSGKNTAIITAINELLRSEKVEMDLPDGRMGEFTRGQRDPLAIHNPRLEYSILYTNYPQYFSPSGNLIREMNRGGIEDYIKASPGEVDPELELRLRMAMYTLDRIMSWVVMENLSEPSDKLTILFSDRGPWSQVMTIAFWLEKHKRIDELDSYVRRYADPRNEDNPDYHFYKYVNPNVTLFVPQKQSLTFLDQLERQEIVDIGTEGYKKMLELNPDIKVIHPQQNGGIWRPPKTIAHELLAQNGITVVEGIKDKVFGGKDKLIFDFFDDRRKGDLRMIGPSSTLLSLFPHAKGYLRKDEGNYYREESDFWSDYMEWLILSIWEDDKVYERYGRENDRKGMLDKAEKDMARLISHVMERFYISPEVEKGLSEEIVRSVHYVFETFTGGELLSLIRFLEARSGMGPGYSRFIETTFLK